MYHPPTPATERYARRSLQRRTRLDSSTHQGEPAANEPIKAILKHFGLRTSLIRLKVLEAVLAAHLEQRTLGVRGLHGQLEKQGVPLAFLSVREVLKRLHSVGVICLGADKSYALTEAARALVAAKAP